MERRYYTLYKTEYEISPLNRLIKNIGYGEQWHDQDKGIETDYLLNRKEVFPEWGIEVDEDLGTLDYSDMLRYSFTVPAHAGLVNHSMRIKVTFPFSFYPSMYNSSNIYIKNLDTGESRVVNNESETIWPAGNYFLRTNCNNSTATEVLDRGALYIVYTGDYADLPLPFEDPWPRTDDTPFLRCNQYKKTATGVEMIGEYENGQLSVTKVTGEDNQVSYQFVDIKGQTILTRELNENEQYDTYYIYDDFGNVCYVLPPLAVDNATDFSDENEIMKQYAYIYKYDSLNRCIWKKLPGCEPIRFIYDKADRLIFTQNGEQLKKGEWSFSIPDALGRIVLTGSCSNELDATSDPLRNILVKASWKKNTNLLKGYEVEGIGLDSPQVLVVNYYDNYEFMGLNDIPSITDTNFKPEAITGYGVQYTGGYKGLLTGTITTLLGDTTGFSPSVFYYDTYNRIVQVKSCNHMQGGIDKEYIAYNFTGQPVKRKQVHQANGQNARSELYEYAYDHAGRLLEVTHQLDDKAPVFLAENQYDQLGRISNTKVNDSYLLQTSFSYNVRSWMKKIDAGDLFAEELTYTPSGNISEMKWQKGNNKRQYTYEYDDLSRLTRANYNQPTIQIGSYNTAYSDAYGISVGDEVGNYNTSYSYDKQGNILTLSRYGKQSEESNSYGLVDNLSMTYQGNQLIQVKDNSGTTETAPSGNFRDFTAGRGEYQYNANGALTKDSHKGITEIEYNFLNLPRRMDIKSPIAEARNEYLYSATGTKLRVTQKWNPEFNPEAEPSGQIDESKLTEKKVTDYIGNKIYENGRLKRILVPGGYYDEEAEKYYFYLSDHLGNNRIVANQDGEVIQETDYYPFGSSFAEATNEEAQPYKYNGKELDSKHGLNLYDYSARYYEPAIGRFTTVDPLAEKYYSISPYAYCMNNPINAIDIDGRLVIFINGFHLGDGGSSKYWGEFSNAVMNHLNEKVAVYRDGNPGGALKTISSTIASMEPGRQAREKMIMDASINSNYKLDHRFSGATLKPTNRHFMGKAQGTIDAPFILKLITNSDGNIKETIKVITHSLGSAYGKGYIEALLNYFEENGIDRNVIEFEADFAPFQPTKQKAVNGIPTYQFSHDKDWVAGKNKMENAIYMNTQEDENRGHSINSFINQIINLPTGNYRVVNGQIQKNE